MPEFRPVVLPKEGVSDDSYLFQEMVKEDGALAEAGECIARMESSKATVEINAPCRGHVFYRFAKGQDIPVGEVLAVISGDGTRPPSGTISLQARTPPAEPAAYPEDTVRTRVTPLAKRMMESHKLGFSAFPLQSRIDKAAVEAALAIANGDFPTSKGAPRFSEAAQAAMTALGIAPERFRGAGLVIAEDVRRVADSERGTTESVADPGRIGKPDTRPASEAFASSERVPLTKSKKSEIAFLREGQKDALPSTITSLVDARGFFDRETGDPSPRLLPIIVYEVSRLLKRFPELNGCFAEDALLQRSEINIGIAMEIESGLKVPVVKGAHELGIDALQEAISELALRYLENALGLEELSGGTFTITDLSAERVSAFQPLIARGQAAILGVGGRQGAGGTASAFPLSLTFDHRVSTGRRASRFLRELRERLESYGAALSPQLPSAAEPVPACIRCLNRENDLLEGQYLIAIRAKGKERFLCSACLAGW